MKKLNIWLILFSFIMITLSINQGAYAQAGFNDPRVMLQGFYWESYRHGHPNKFPKFGDKKWYEIVKKQAEKIREGRFDLIWLPPPSYAGKYSAGYNPKEYFNLNNSYGNFEQHRAMLEALLENGVEPVADIVINHRDGSKGWASFKNPDWGTWAICRDDEAFRKKRSEVFDIPIRDRGAKEERPKEYTHHKGTTYQYDAFRDIDHTNKIVQCDIIQYLKQLKSMGYRGWRYDMVHGFHAKRLAKYNEATNPTFSVGEYDWDKDGEQRGWIWYTATTPGDLSTSSSVFDFRTHFILKDNKGNYSAWYGKGNGIGKLGDTTDKLPWKNRAVTFLENHDTGYRTNPDGTPEKHHKHDNFANNWEVEQAYAYILTHPGVPTVYWKHYFDWGRDLRNKIKALINARKVAGVTAGSDFFTQNNARAKNVYAAMVAGKKGRLYVRIGGNDDSWQPQFSGYQNYKEYAHGLGWKVWVSLPKNPKVQQAHLKRAFEIPVYEKPTPCQSKTPPPPPTTGTGKTPQHTPRTAFVHLFEWRWDDIAKECETFLGPKGFAAVQVSPPSEHRVVAHATLSNGKKVNRPWWERYQPISYQLVSRSGDRQAFEDMVKRCQAVGVKIYVDAVINHMTGAKFDSDPAFGTGIGGRTFDYYNYPDYNQAEHFHACKQNIGGDYHNKWKVQNCNLLELADLNTGSDYVQQTIVNYLNDLVGIGVKGFRIDAAKHIEANELHQILAKVNVPSGEIYQEIIESPGEPIQASEYFQNGLVTEFDYGKKIAEFFKGGRLADLKTLGESWSELMPSNKAVVFTDNHDKQRGHGGGGDYLTYKDGKQYDLANVFMLAWPYGYPKIMSSYAFEDTDVGPPSTDGMTNPIYQGDTPNCFKDWKCEHRWHPIANMVAFRNYTASAWQVDNWWDNGNNQIAFSRGDKGFIVINKESTPLEQTFQTGLPAGQYCNTWDSELVDKQCTGTTITVNQDSTAYIRVEPWTAAAIHVGFKPAIDMICQQPTQDWKRTVVFIYGKTLWGQDMFIRGGIDHDYANKTFNKSCSKSNYNCAIPIHHRNLKNDTTKPWKVGDCYLDWYGQENTQNSVSHKIRALGSPADWTTNKWPSKWKEKRTVAQNGFGEEVLNKYGHHYWMLDVDMDCSKTVNGWFELKSYISNGPSWEKDIRQPDTPYNSINHFGKCGYINVFKRNENQLVKINPLK